MSELAIKARLGRLDALTARETLSRNLFARRSVFGARMRRPSAVGKQIRTVFGSVVAA